MVDGPSIERSLLGRDISREVASLVKQAPADKYSTVRRLLADARSGKIDRETFKEFVRRTNTFALVAEIQNWETYSQK
jgi:hypothetical protein